ncbi:MAG: hypothetical protein JRI98_11075 [Deltaproteobacteria bacterium]|nr:hypothetical protein [Deltaproteobacteria bacterium]
MIRSSGEGTTIEMEADGCALLGVTVDGSGGRFDTLDAAVHVVADDVRVQGRDPGPRRRAAWPSG